MPPPGFQLIPARLDPAAQRALLDAVLERLGAAPFYRPVTPGGQPMSVEMTNFGPLGWITDAAGYRYEPAHPVTGAPWPPIPEQLTVLWAELCDAATPADACLVNRYAAPSGGDADVHTMRKLTLCFVLRFGYLLQFLGCHGVFHCARCSRMPWGVTLPATSRS